MRHCNYPTIRFIAWEQRTPYGQIFVPDPSLRGRYILTDRSVALVGCGMCKSIPGEPCKGKQGYHATTHCVRRDALRWGGHRGKPVKDVIPPPVENYDWEQFCT